MKIKKAIIPAAGSGTRLMPATRSQPKEMLPVGRKPAIQHVVEEICAAGIRQILIVTNQKKRAIEDHFDAVNGNDFDEIEFFYTRQGEPKGLADAIARAEHFVGNEPFIVCLGDSIIESRSPGKILRKMIDLFTEELVKVTILFEEVDRKSVSSYGIASPKGEVKSDKFMVDKLIEKPKIEEAPSNLAIAARYIFSPEIFRYIDRTTAGVNGEIQITDSIGLMLAEGSEVLGVKLRPDEKRYDIGNFKSYFEAFFSMSMADLELGDRFKKYVLNELQIKWKELDET